MRKRAPDDPQRSVASTSANLLILALPVIKLHPAIACALLFCASTVQAVPVYYATRTAFLSAVGSSITDDYTAYAPGNYSNAVMSAVLGETAYQSLTFPNQNQVGGVFVKGDGSNYCSGCNGNFRLGFTLTSLSVGGGVFGVGLDIILNKSSDVLPQVAGGVLVTFTDGSSEQIWVPPVGYDPQTGLYKSDLYFLGVADERGIASVTVGTEPTSQRHFWVIDNLTIGASPSVASEPETLALLGLGLAGIGFRWRSRLLA